MNIVRQLERCKDLFIEDFSVIFGSFESPEVFNLLRGARQFSQKIPLVCWSYTVESKLTCFTIGNISLMLILIRVTKG